QQVNAERMKHGLNALVWSDDLARVAQNHSSLMARTQLFEHSGNQYYNCMGENIMKRSGSSNIASANEVVGSWMNSDGHRAAILFESHAKAGAGIAQSTNGDSYYTLIMDSTQC